MSRREDIDKRARVCVTVCTRHASNFKVRHSAILGNESCPLAVVPTGFLPTRQPVHFTPKQLHRRKLLILSHQLQKTVCWKGVVDVLIFIIW